jgi:hypothetical protein
MELLKYINKRLDYNNEIQYVYADTINYSINRQMQPIRALYNSPDTLSTYVPGRKTINVNLSTTDSKAHLLKDGQDVNISVSYYKDYDMRTDNIFLTDISILSRKITKDIVSNHYLYIFELTASTLEFSKV